MKLYLLLYDENGTLAKQLLKGVPCNEKIGKSVGQANKNMIALMHALYHDTLRLWGTMQARFCLLSSQL